MAKGCSLHLGLNRIDRTHYGSDGTLKGCIADAKAMAELAQATGFAVEDVLLDDGATSIALASRMTGLADRLDEGDILLLTYSGHGGQVPDLDGDETSDRLDETWCLFDRMLLDDELYRMFGRFAPDVRIVMLSDSCHSGTMARDALVLGRAYDDLAAGIKAAAKVLAPEARPLEGYDRVRLLEPTVTLKAFRDHKALYQAVQAASAGAEKGSAIGAGVILISGCQDSQVSLDGDDHGLFTQALLDIWKDGAFEGSYGDFRRSIAREAAPYQRPNLFKAGRVAKAFLKQKPFTI